MVSVNIYKKKKKKQQKNPTNNELSANGIINEKSV